MKETKAFTISSRGGIGNENSLFPTNLEKKLCGPVTSYIIQFKDIDV